MSRGEDRRLVLLQVAVVGEREALDRREEAGEPADRGSGLAPHEFRDVGLSFCGIIDEPVAADSGSRTNPNSEVAQSTISSPIRERCVKSTAAAYR